MPFRDETLNPERSFAGDPNPPARASGTVFSGTPISQAPMDAPPMAEATPATGPSHKAGEGKNKPIFRVIRGDAAGEFEVYAWQSDGNADLIAKTSLPGVEGVLNSITPYDEGARHWEIPEDAAKSLMQGRLTYPEFLARKWDAGEATAVRGALGAQLLRGEVDEAEAMARGDIELLKAQVAERPDSAWSAPGLEKFVVGARNITGAAVEMLPFMVRGAVEGAKGAATMGGGAAALIASLPATGGLSAPFAAPAVAGMMATGAAYGVFKHSAEVEGGNALLDLRKAGVPLDKARPTAAAIGAGVGALEVVGFRFLTAPLKRAFLKKAVTEGPIKAALDKWYVSYVKETLGESAVEGAQEAWTQGLTNLLLTVEKQGESGQDLLTERKGVLSAAVQAFASSLGPMALIRAPGAALDVMRERGETVQAAREATALESRVEKGLAALEEPAAPAATTGAQLEGVPATSQALNIPPEVRAEFEAGMASLPAPEAVPALPAPEAEAVAEVPALPAPEAEAQTPAAAAPEAQTPTLSLTPEEETASAAAVTDAVDALEEGSITLEDFVKEVDEATTPALARASERIQGAVTDLKTRGLKRTIRTEYNNILGELRELKRARQALIRAGVPTKALDAKIAPLLDARDELAPLATKEASVEAAGLAAISERGLTKNISVLPSQVDEIVDMALREGEKETARIQRELEAEKARGGKAAIRAEKRAERLANKAFIEGRKEVIKTRATLIQAVASRNKLTNADVRKLLKNKNFGLGSDTVFRNWLETEFTPAAEAAASRKEALTEYLKLRKEKNFKKEAKYRKLHDLPPIYKMTEKELRDYTEALRQFEEGDEFLPPERVKALRGTAIGGTETYSQFLAATSEYLGRPVSELANVKVGELDLHRYTVSLARQNAYMDLLARMTDEAVNVRAKARALAFRDVMYRLGAKAVKSRARRLGLGVERVVRWISQQQKEIFDFIEEEEVQARADKWSALTPEEQEFAAFIVSFFERAYNYLVQQSELKSRFTGGVYIPHTPRPISEVITDIREKGLSTLWKEIQQRLTKLDEELGATTSSGKAVGLQAFFKNSLRRTGALEPSRNLFKAMEVYANALFEKQALDELVPIIDTLTRALEKQALDPDAAKRVTEFTAQYLNAKKGKVSWIVNQGGALEATIRGLAALVGQAHIAANVLVQFVAPIGNKISEFMVIREEGLVKSRARRLTKKGRALLRNYKVFRGEGPIETMLQPGRTPQENLATLLYALLKSSHVNTMGNVLLALATDAEYESGVISDERLSEMRRQAARWIDVEGMKSVRGSSVAGSALMKFSSWKVPIVSSLLDDLGALSRSIRGKEKGLTWGQTRELIQIAEVMTVALTLWYLSSVDEDDDSFGAQFTRRALQEALTLLQANDISLLAKGGPVVAWTGRLINAVGLLLSMERRESDDKLKGLEEAKRLLPLSGALRSGIALMEWLGVKEPDEE